MAGSVTLASSRPALRSMASSFHISKRLAPLYLTRGITIKPKQATTSPSDSKMPSTSSASATSRAMHLHGHEHWPLHKQPNNPEAGNKAFADFDLKDRVFVVTGGARGLGLNLAEALCEAGGKVYSLDRLSEPSEQFLKAQEKAESNFGAELHYKQVDVLDHNDLEKTIGSIAYEHKRVDGLIAAAGIQQITPAIEYTYEDIKKMMDVNYTGVFLSATAVARQMMKYKIKGSILLVGSMSGSIANKGLVSPVYNSSKAAVVQLGRSLAMEWGRVQKDGTGGIRVNVLSPGHIMTPMVTQEFERSPGLCEFWESENLLGRIADPAEFKGAALFALSNASSFMTGSNMIIDGGHTAW